MRMNNISDVAAGASYITSLSSGGYWLLQLLDKVSPSQWAAIGVIASILLGLLTYLTNLYFKIKDDRRKEARDNGFQQN
jgi:poly(3-hydroxybutyrate) depolymerase